MKKVLVFCVLVALWLSLDGSDAWAIDVGWMQKGVRAWYFGAVGSTTSSDAEEAYLFSAVNGTNVQVTKHSGMNHWGTTNAPDTSTYSFLDKGPCWIHPQVLQTLQSGDTWKGQVIATVLRESHTYNTFKAQFSFPYLLLPMKALFDLKAQRDLVKIVYYIQGFSTGIAYFDADTGLLLLYQTSSGFVTVFFLLSEINYDFATQRAFAEDNGPHTGFKSSVLEQQMMPFPDNRGGVVFIQSSVESRYGTTVQMWVSTSESGNIGSYMPPFESYCFFGSVPVLRRINMTDAPNYPPDQWNAYGQYLWWWVPTGVLQNSTINVFGVPMTRTSTSPYTFTATQQLAGLYFSKLWFDNDGYMTAFSAKDSTTGLDIDPERSASYYNNSTTVYGLAYYKNTMGRATPAKIEMVDFDGDGSNDVAAFHLASDQFFTDYTGNMGQYGWGGSNSYPLVWDYDGNGTTEVSIYHIPTNQWFVKGVPGDNLGQFGWGGDESVPVPGDYDGDGVIERAFYHFPTNRWFVEGQAPVDFGWGGADVIPIAADYDGDGTTDMMLYHIPTNQWFVYGIGNLGQFGWNGSECIPVPGDWDGDGKTEIGIYHWPSNQWFWRDQNGTDHFLGQYGWGGMASFPIPGDYNGDGVMERAFYRPSENRWFIEGEADFVWGWGGTEFMPITSQMAIFNWFRFVLGMFQ